MKGTYCLPGFLLLLLFSCSVYGQQSYTGELVIKKSGPIKGKIEVDLNGTNNEMISFAEEMIIQHKDRRPEVTYRSPVKINVALISHIIINDTPYYFRDIKYDYNEKYKMNSCVRLISGTLDCGIFQSGRSYGKDNIFIKLPNNDYSKLIDIDFDYYKATLGWHIMAFGKCDALKTKMSGKLEGYKWDDNTSRDDRLTMWKQWIKEFNDCK